MVLAPDWTERPGSAFGWQYLHQGGRFDATSGLYHFRNRDYSPTLGRWTSLDPIRYAAGDVNLYRALGNGPGIWLDPSGLDRIDRTQAGNQTLLWYVDEKFIGSDKKFFVGVLVTINGEQFARRYVGGQPLYVPLAKVNSTTGFWESTPSNWDQWFRDNAASVNEPSIKNLQMQEGISRSNWNDLAIGQKQIQGLAETAIYWNAGAGFNAAPTAAANRAVAATRAPNKPFNRVPPEQPPFDPSGTLGAAKAWTIKGRLKHAQLPTTGKIRYVPTEGHPPSQPLPRGPNGGYLDRFGNEWLKGPSRTPGQPFEWDVQIGQNATPGFRALSRDGKHVNVSLDGKVTH